MKIPPFSEMSLNDLEFLDRMVTMKKPQKVLEIGVSAGGTTSFLLDRLAPTAELHSLDLEKGYYRKPHLPTGFVAADMYDESKHARWFRHFGTDVAYCGDEIGDGVDFLILDTMHALPGEVLSFIAAFPLLADGCIVFLHDISLHVREKGPAPLPPAYEQEAYANPLLFSSIHSSEKYLAAGIAPDSAALVLDREKAMDCMYMVFNILFLPWFYVPKEGIVGGTAEVVKKHYPPHYTDLFERAVAYNRAIAEYN